MSRQNVPQGTQPPRDFSPGGPPQDGALSDARRFRGTKYACYYTYLSMSSVFCLPPMLFVTFHERYGISYTLLGTLVLANFVTQLAVDLLMTFFASRFRIRTVLRVMPLLTSLGLLVYALSPVLFPRFVYAGLLTGTVIFSVAAGLCEVLLSPLVAALPSQHPERDMSTLHSLYAYGVLTVVLTSSLFLRLWGAGRWMYLVLLWAVPPVFSFLLFCVCPLPQVNLTSPDGKTNSPGKRKRKGLALCAACIFFGSAAENAMTNWISSYLEISVQLPKMAADLLGLAGFAVLLGLTRTAYAKWGKHIYPVLLAGMAGAAACYVLAALLSGPPALLACVLTGVCTSMLWPGNLIYMEEKFPHSGVAAYALMAAGGDFGASVAPQALGAIVDAVSASEWAIRRSGALSLSPDQLGLRVGMLIASLFPLAGTLLLLYMRRYFASRKIP